MAKPTLVSEVKAELENYPTIPGWQRELAIALAESFLEEPNAAVAAQLRTLMNDIRNATPAVVEGDASDELTRRRKERRERNNDSDAREAESSVGT